MSPLSSSTCRLINLGNMRSHTRSSVNKASMNSSINVRSYPAIVKNRTVRCKSRRRTSDTYSYSLGAISYNLSAAAPITHTHPPLEMSFLYTALLVLLGICRSPSNNKYWQNMNTRESAYLNSSALRYSTKISFSGWICNSFSSKHRNSVGLWFPYTPPMKRNSSALSMSVSAIVKARNLELIHQKTQGEAGENKTNLSVRNSVLSSN